MSNRVVVQEGYEIPFAGFDGYRRRKKRRSSRRRSRRGGGRSRQQSKMKDCAKRWRSHRGSRSYRAFMRDCLRK